MKAWRNRLIFVGVVALGILAYVIYIHSFTIYEFDHLTVVQDFGESRPFEPILGHLVEGFVRAAQTPYLAMYICEGTTHLAVVDLRNNHVWYSNPPGVDDDTGANPFERGTMRSHVGFRFFNEARMRQFRWLFPDSVYHEQFEIFSIPNGVRIEYVIGNLDIGIDFLPFYIEEEFFYERIFANVETRADERTLIQFWFPSDDRPGFYQMSEGARMPIHAANMLRIFESVGWTFYETIEANERAGADVVLDFDYFNMTLEFILDRDRLIANLPLSEFTTDALAQPFNLDFMKFFGAGGLDDEGFMLVPSGAGGVIMFNNGKEREEQFISAVYGVDSLTTIIRPQVMQPVRLPVFGIQNNGAGILAHVYSGSALAIVNAEVAGRTNSYNNAWFSFNLRASTDLPMPGGGMDMTVVQQDIYQGDITIIYHFLANGGVGEMAQAYQGFLVETGVLTPLDGPGDRSFFMDVVGAIDIQRHIMGTPFMTTEVMTTLTDAERFVDMLNAGGVEPVQMQLHGWFNRGINHDVAKNIRRINSVGSKREMLDLNERLQADGGGLFPAVGFQHVNWFSRNFNRTFESAKTLAGYVGFRNRDTWRDSITIQFSMYRNDWYNLVHPGVLPFHVDRFLPAFERRTDMDSLALTDLGDIVTESLFRRDAVDRESARLIAKEQLGRIENEIPNLLISGGNDYSLRFATHIVDAPVMTDLFYIIDYEVPFFPMVVHGFMEFAGRPANMMEHFCPTRMLLNSMTTGASPRYTFTAAHTREAQFSPHERMYSTMYENWMERAIEHYNIFNRVFAPLRGERMVDFEVLAGGYMYVGGRQVTVTEFSDGTRIYVNNTTRPFVSDGVEIPPEGFTVRGA
ncbi:MAG: DUF5696 domain-containing protein [Defluviitaleaceae bacterium]|nr:DUF5696 domain-containing protein [Defluviitaleaceae bacterium]